MRKASDTPIFDTKHGAFDRPMGLPDEVRGVLIKFGVIRPSYTLDGRALSKAATMQILPMQTRSG